MSPRRQKRTAGDGGVQIVGDVFRTKGIPMVIVRVGVHGRRIILANVDGDGRAKPPKASRCVHNRSLRAAPLGAGGIDTRDPEAVANLCRACAYEIALIEDGRGGVER